MIILKPRNNFNFSMCEEEFCQEDSTRIWAGKETRIVDFCDLHYNQAQEEK